ncbi:hypothetical protein BJX65DRAFT_288247 [Aspergillus insuetus]
MHQERIAGSRRYGNEVDKSGLPVMQQLLVTKYDTGNSRHSMWLVPDACPNIDCRGLVLTVAHGSVREGSFAPPETDTIPFTHFLESNTTATGGLLLIALVAIFTARPTAGT